MKKMILSVAAVAMLAVAVSCSCGNCCGKKADKKCACDSTACACDSCASCDSCAKADTVVVAE